MTLFALLLAAMIVAALALLLPAFRRREDDGVDREQTNVVIARERLAELEAARDSGEMSAEDFAQAEKELQLSLATDLARAGQSGRRGGKPLLLVLIALVPISALGLYLQLGSPQFLDVAGPGAGGAVERLAASVGKEPPPVEEMVAGLEKRLAEAPNDPDGWYMLGRSYMSMERYDDAVRAFERLRELTDNHPAALVALADAVAMTQGGKMAGRPTELIDQALVADPQNPTALWLAGQAAEEAGHHKQAIGHWLKALPAMAQEPQLGEQLRTMIAKAAIDAGMSPDDLVAMRDAMGLTAQTAVPAPAVEQSPAASGDGKAVTVAVRIDPRLLDKVSPDDTLFVFARAQSGPPMPLAVGRFTLATMPETIVLDDSSAMAPQLRISGFDKVNVQARIAKGGQPTAQSGDLQSAPVPAVVGGDGVMELVIDQVVP